MKIEGMNLLFVGLTGFISVAITQLLTIDVNKIDSWLTFALYCFAIALPLCVFLILITEPQFGAVQNSRTIPTPEWYFVLSTLTVIVGFLGIAALFGHFSLPLGAIFFVGSIAVLIIQDKLGRRQ